MGLWPIYISTYSNTSAGNGRADEGGIHELIEAGRLNRVKAVDLTT